MLKKSKQLAVADPGFPVGGHGPRRGGHGLPRQLHFENFVCQNERIWTLRGRAPGTPPLDPPMIGTVSFILGTEHYFQMFSSALNLTNSVQIHNVSRSKNLLQKKDIEDRNK